MAESIRDRLAQVNERISRAAARVGRHGSSVRLVAVSKMVPLDAIRQALEAGVMTLGENRVQEAKTKIPLLAGLAAWHLVGHLQTNKAKLAVQLFEMIHSLDSLKLAQELDKYGCQSSTAVHCLLEVNLGGEESKSGTTEESVRSVLEGARQLSNLRIDGLMTIPPYFANPESVRPYFRRLRILRDKLEGEGWRLPELSMGMTHDFEVAIEEGATMVRIGTGIFGARPAESP